MNKRGIKLIILRHSFDNEKIKWKITIFELILYFFKIIIDQKFFWKLHNNLILHRNFVRKSFQSAIIELSIFSCSLRHWYSNIVFVYVRPNLRSA